MYLAIFKLKEAPFQPEPDPRFLYLSQTHARAKAYMESALAGADDFVAISGAAGTGKTTLLETVRQELGRAVVVARYSPTSTPTSARAFLESLLDQCGFLPFRGGKAALLATLTDYLGKQRAAGRKALLLVDDAHDLGTALLEELRMLAGIEPGGESLLRVILVGQPGLDQLLAAPEMATLAQRVRLRFQLAALTAEQTRGYIVHRLAIAGSQGRDIFEASCFERIHRYTEGVPLRINLLCDAALRGAGDAGRGQVSEADLDSAARQLQWHEVTPGAGPALAEGGASARHHAAQRGTGAAAALVGRLRVLSAGQLVIEHELFRGRMMIGRAADADLRIDDRTISRHHCQIICTDKLTTIQDFNSTNGVYVNDRRVRRHALRDGDVFLLGAYHVEYSDLRSAAGAEGVGANAGGAESTRMTESDGETTQN